MSNARPSAGIVPPAARAAAILVSLVVAAIAGIESRALAQSDRLDSVTVKTTDLGNGLYMLAGAGGNIGLSVGPDGTFLIDDDYAPLTDRIKAAIAAITDKPVRFVVNTHLHGDHTGGNEALGKDGAVIVAHDNVRRRMSVTQISAAWNDTTPAAPHAALPVLTFAESVTFHLNGEMIHVRHTPPAHTDGDAVILFTGANVLHVGDLFFNSFYPFVDVENGGAIEGYVTAIDRILPFIDDATKVIPGHGPLSDKAGLREFRDMLADVAGTVKELAAQKKTKDEVVAARPTAKFDAKWGNGFLAPDQFVSLVYDDVTRAR
jgi:glyoxylase-like metal-dependent hydrolase (beta-lactamase superfamily II)